MTNKNCRTLHFSSIDDNGSVCGLSLCASPTLIKTFHVACNFTSKQLFIVARKLVEMS